MKAPLIDPFARAITYLRVSVTEMRFSLCLLHGRNMKFLPKKICALEELDRMCSTFVALGVKKLRI